MKNPSRLRELASWYRDLAERTGNPWIWEARLHTAEDLETEADRLEDAAAGASERANIRLPLTDDDR